MRVLSGEEGERLRGENRKVVESFNKMCLEDTGKPDLKAKIEKMQLVFE